MAPTLTFIKISDEYVLPVKVFVNRKSIQKGLQNTIFEASLSPQALVRLQKPAVRIYLSKADTEHLIEEIKPELLQMTDLKHDIRKPFGRVKEVTKAGRNRIRLYYEGTWTLEFYIDTKKWTMLQEVMSNGYSEEYTSMGFVVTRVEEAEPKVEILIEDDPMPQEDVELIDEKQPIKYEYVGKKVLPQALQIHVLQRPKTLK